MDLRLQRIQTSCGALCDTRRPTRGDCNFRAQCIGHTTAPVDCGWLLADGTGLDAQREQAIAPREPPARWHDEFTMHGRYPVRPMYRDDPSEARVGHAVGGNATVASPDWDEARINSMAEHAARGTMWPRYNQLNRALIRGMRHANLTNKRVLVIGSTSPWVEAICLAAGAAQVVTLEYARIVTNHPLVTTLVPAEFLARARRGALPRFDRVVTASSVEHSGLGRYGDSLNPWGDIIAIARAWCVSAEDARLVIAVPTAFNGKATEAETDAEAEHLGTDRLKFNAGRTYGPVRYPYLVTNWRFDHRVPTDAIRPSWGQTVYVFRRAAAPSRSRSAG